MKLPPKASFLLFDMDGTLVDTEPIGPQVFKEQLERHRVTPTPDEQILFTKIWRRDGTDIKQDEWLPEIAKRYGIDLSAKAYLQEFYDIYVAAIVAAPALPGVDKLLTRLKTENKYKLALVTASKRHQVAAICEQRGWEAVFDVVVSSEDFTKHKPDPEPYLVGIEKLGAEPSHCVVFEDSKNGVKAAAAAGCYVIGLRAGNATPQDLTHANLVIDSFEDLGIT